MGLFVPNSPEPVPCPAFWRLSLIQCYALGGSLALSYVFWPDAVISILLAGLVTVLGQSFWVWRSLLGFGDPHSRRYLAGAISGLIGKWVITGTGLILIWRSDLQISVAATLITFFGLNTLAALAAPFLILRPR